MVSKRIIKVYLVLRNLGFLLFYKKPIILSFEDTIKEIVINKKSLSRFGDGELRLLLDEGEIGFQSRNIILRQKLNEVIDAKLDNLLIALPNTFGLCRQYTLDSQIFWYGFNFLYGKRILSRLNLNKVYGNAMISRFYIADKNKSGYIISNKFNILKKIWNNKDILVVEGEKTKLGVGNDLFVNVKSVFRILCPSKDAFNMYHEILSAAKSHSNDKLVLLALGPTASILAYDLTKFGFWAIDVGHIDIEYGWFLKGVKSKTSIHGKYVNEVENNIEDTEPVNQEYLDSIIVKLNA